MTNEPAPELDSNGNPAPLQPGDRVVFIPWKIEGTVIKQTLHYDCDETFWGNLKLMMDNGNRVECNCWQTKKVEGPDQVSFGPAD